MQAYALPLAAGIGAYGLSAERHGTFGQVQTGYALTMSVGHVYLKRRLALLFHHDIQRYFYL